MKKIVRPAGLVAFIGLIALFAAIWFLAAGWLIKLAIEEGGSTAVGAQVELDDAALTFSPFGVTLSNLQITDPDNPMQNLVQLGVVEARIEPGKLLWGQLIVDELVAERVRLNTPRARSGALAEPRSAAPEKRSPESDGPPADLAALKKNLPSVDEILAREPLATLALSEAFGQRVASSREQIEQRLEALPDQAALQAYQQRVDEITAGKVTSLDDFKRRKAALEQLKKDIRRDKEALSAAKEVIKSAKTELGAEFAQLKQAPAQDLAKIREKYSLSSDNLANFGGLFLGEQAQRWIEKAQPWLTQLQQLGQADKHEEPPAPPRGEGRVIRFPARENLPDLLVRQARLGLETGNGNIMVVLTDVTPQPAILGRPMRLKAVGESLAGMEALRVDGVFDHVDPEQASDRLTWTIEGWQLQNVDLLESKKMAVSLARAQLMMNGEADITRGDLQGKVDSRFKNVEWQLGGAQGAGMKSVLAGIDRFSAVVTLGGTPLSPDVRIRSDLDEKLKSSLSRTAKARQAALERRLKTRLDEQVTAVAGPYRERLASFNQYEGDIDQKIATTEALLKAQVKDAMDEQREELKDRLKDKLKGLRF